MKELGIPFEEEKLSFNLPDWKERILKIAPTGRVPILVDGKTVVWDTMAIVEYVAERFTDKPIWPEDPVARARARSVTAEMHSGFHSLRNFMPMNISARLPGLGWNLQVQDDIDRIIEIWTDARTQFGAQGAMLFGAFSAADAVFAPVVWRFVTHAVELPKVCNDYMEAVRGLESMKAWEQEALSENEFVAMDEPYRRENHTRKS